MTAVSGRVEWLSRFGIAGWARAGKEPVTLEVSAGARLLGVVRAADYRPDLAAAGEGDGTGGFALWFDPPLLGPAAVRVATPAGAALPGTPVAVPPLPRPPPGKDWPPGKLAADVGPPLALVIDEAAPDVARDAGSAAVTSHMGALRRLGYAVAFATRATAAATIAGSAGRVRLAYLHRLRSMLDWAGPIRAANPGVRVLYALADLESLRVARAADVLGGAPPRGLLAAEAAALAEADAVITHSAAEAAVLAARHPGLAVHVVPWAIGVAPVTTPFGVRRGIGFLGNFGHAPNRDAAAMLLEAVMPRVWRRGRVPCVIAGHRPPPALLARAGEQVRVLASLPDAAALWRQVRVSAAPLRFGAGIKGKVLESLAAGIPCVCAPLAAEGIALPEGLLAADPEAMAERLWRLHATEAENAAAAAAGLALVGNGYTEATVALALGRALAVTG
jgi:glycosyltransferase involved in cell wall biosynthesis